MTLSKELRETIETNLTAFCHRKIPLEHRQQLRLNYTIRDHHVTLTEERVAFREPSAWISNPIAQFRHEPGNGLWTLFCADRNKRWHRYQPAEPARDIGALLYAMENDTTGIFWG